MRAKEVALIACPNGLGHVRRMLSLAHELRVQGAQVTIFAPKDRVNKLASIYLVKVPQIYPIDNYFERSKPYLLDFQAVKKLESEISQFDVVVSDNLLEILAVRPDSWISGSFFWHRSLKCFPQSHKQKIDDLLLNTFPRLITSSIFESDYLAEMTRIHRVGLYSFDSLTNHIGNEREDALLSCGKGGHCESITNSLLNKIIKLPKPNLNTLWIEPILYRSTMPDWIQPADYTPNMYHRLRFAVVRAGVGTLTDLIVSGVPIFTYFEEDNQEICLNASRIDRYKYGKALDNLEHAWHSAALFLDQKLSTDQMLSDRFKLDSNGAMQAAQLIL